MPERRGRKAQSAEAPRSDHDGKTGYYTLVGGEALQKKLFEAERFFVIGKHPDDQPPVLSQCLFVIG